jgi:hypothetical protein
MTPTNKRTAHACKNHTSAILSRKPFSVTRQTSGRLNASHSLKAADFLFRCPHTWQGVKRLLAPSRSLSELISAAYGLQPQKPTKCNPCKEFLNNCPPSIDPANFEAIVTIVHNRPPIDSPILRSTMRGINIKQILNLNIKQILNLNIKQILSVNIKKLLNNNIKKLLNVIIKKTLNAIIKKK